MGKNIDRESVLKALRANRLAALATASAAGEPHAALVLFAVDDDFNFYFVTREDTSKAANISANPSVSLCIGTEPPLHVQVSGRAEAVGDSELRAKMLSALAVVGAGLEGMWPPILHIGDSGYVLFKLVPKRIRVLDLTDQSIAAGESPFSELI